MRVLTMTIIGPDRPGLVQLLSRTISDNDGNWLESQLAHLGGQFAGIVRVEIEDDRAPGLETALVALASSGLRFLIATEDYAESSAGTAILMELVATDRVGIVRDVSAALSSHGINVESWTTTSEAAPMGAGRLFKASAVLTAADGSAIDRVRAELEAIANDVMVDFRKAEG